MFWDPPLFYEADTVSSIPSGKWGNRSLRTLCSFLGSLIPSHPTIEEQIQDLDPGWSSSQGYVPNHCTTQFVLLPPLPSPPLSPSLTLLQPHTRHTLSCLRKIEPEWDSTLHWLDWERTGKCWMKSSIDGGEENRTHIQQMCSLTVLRKTPEQQLQPSALNPENCLHVCAKTRVQRCALGLPWQCSG